MRTLAIGLNKLANDRMVKVAQFTEVKANLNAADRSLRNILIYEDRGTRDAEMKTIAKLRAANVDPLAKLNATILLPRPRGYLKTIDDYLGSYQASQDQVIKLALNGRKAEAARLLSLETTPLQNLVFQAVDDSREFQREMAAKQTQESIDIAVNAMILMNAAALAKLVFSAVLAWVVIRDLSLSLGAQPEELSEAVGRIAAGDLSSDLKVKAGDTRSVLSAISRMRQSFSDALARVHERSEGVAAASS
jgi:methyl-accepting chemotaxis protein